MSKWISIKNGRSDLLRYVRENDDDGAEWLHPLVVAEVVTHLQPVTSSAFSPGAAGAGEDGFVSRRDLPGERQEWLVCEGPSTPQELKDWEYVVIVTASSAVHHGREVTHEGQQITLAQIVRRAQAVVNKVEDPNFDVTGDFFDFTNIGEE